MVRCPLPQLELELQADRAIAAAVVLLYELGPGQDLDELRAERALEAERASGTRQRET